MRSIPPDLGSPLRLAVTLRVVFASGWRLPGIKTGRTRLHKKPCGSWRRRRKGLAPARGVERICGRATQGGVAGSASAGKGTPTRAKTRFRPPNRTNPFFLDTLAWAYFRTGDAPKAAETEREALSLLPADAKGGLHDELDRGLNTFLAGTQPLESLISFSLSIPQLPIGDVKATGMAEAVMAGFCGNCGFPLGANSAFCPNCGTRQSGTAGGPAPAAQIQQPPAPVAAKSGSGLKILMIVSGGLFGHCEFCGRRCVLRGPQGEAGGGREGGQLWRGSSLQSFSQPFRCEGPSRFNLRASVERGSRATARRAGGPHGGSSRNLPLLWTSGPQPKNLPAKVRQILSSARKRQGRMWEAGKSPTR